MQKLSQSELWANPYSTLRYIRLCDKIEIIKSYDNEINNVR